MAHPVHADTVTVHADTVTLVHVVDGTLLMYCTDTLTLSAITGQLSLQMNNVGMLSRLYSSSSSSKLVMMMIIILIRCWPLNGVHNSRWPLDRLQHVSALCDPVTFTF